MKKLKGVLQMHQRIYNAMKIWHLGSRDAIHMGELSSMFQIPQRRLRQIMFDINHNVVKCNGDDINAKIIGDQNGYYMASNQAEMKYFRNKIIKRIKRDVSLLKIIEAHQENQFKMDFDNDEIRLIKEMEKENMKLLTVEEAAKKLRCSREHLYKLMKKYGLPYVVVGARRKIDEDELQAWVKRNNKA